MTYFGGLHGLGTLYWENRDGLKAAASIYGAPSLDVARERVMEHRITHLVFFTWDDLGGTTRACTAAFPSARPRGMSSQSTPPLP